MFKASFKAVNYSFEAYGETEDVAIASLKLGLRNHAKENDFDSEWWQIYKHKFSTAEISLGSCYRDNEQIPQY